MIRVTTTDGAEFIGSDEKEVVRQMRNTQWNAPTAKRDYMCEVIDRVEQSTGTLCPDADERVVTAKEFVEYLASVDLITVTEVESEEVEKILDQARQAT
jgi:hypothetical protein